MFCFVSRYPSLSSSQSHVILESKDDAVVRALAFHQSSSGSIPARCHMWVEFVVGSRPCPEGFSPGSPVFLPPQKSTSPNSNSTRIEDPHETSWGWCGFLSFFSYLFVHLFIFCLFVHLFIYSFCLFACFSFQDDRRHSYPPPNYRYRPY